MALELFRPTIWSRQLVVDLDKAYVFPNVANTKYEGEISGFGSIVKINEIGDITVNDYTEDNDITYQTLTDAQRELVIDQKKYFAFQVDDVAKAQANVEVMQAAMSKAAFAIADVIDAFIAGLYTGAGVTVDNIGTSASAEAIYATAGKKLSILSLITYAHQYLDEANAPSAGRWMVVPPVLHAYLKYAGLVDNLSGNIKRDDSTPVGAGYLGSLLGFDFYSSNNVQGSATAKRVMFGTPDAISYAGQITKIEAVRRDVRFADGVRGLYVYGAKVVRPDRLGVAVVNPSGLTT